MVAPGRNFSAGNQYRYGFNGKENDNEVKGEANQQDYGFRISDPRLGRFWSVDPLASNYPELSTYQFASCRPISAIDLDGLEAKELERESEPIRAQRKREMAYGITYPESKAERHLRNFVTIGLGAPMLGAIGAEALALSTVSAQLTATNVVLWLTNPANQGIVLLFAEGALELVNPDPGYSIDLGPGPGGEVVKSFKLLFKQKSTGKLVEATLEEGAKFKNINEVDWFERLLAEGNSVRLNKVSDVPGLQSADFLVNGIRTELKGISNITSGNLEKRIKEVIEESISQAGKGGNVIIDVSRQQGATMEMMTNIIERLKGKAKEPFTYRIAGQGFELGGSVEKKKP